MRPAHLTTAWNGVWKPSRAVLLAALLLSFSSATNDARAGADPATDQPLSTLEDFARSWGDPARSTHDAERGPVASNETSVESEEILDEGERNGLDPAANANGANDVDREAHAAAAEIETLCERIGAKLSSVSEEECLASRLTTSGARSVAGMPIALREFAPTTEREPAGRVLLFGGIHGDEYSAVTIVFKWLSVLEKHHSGLFHWRVVPVLNPDGLLHQPARRVNHRGVDLNRNFPTPRWHAETEDYWVRRTSRDPRRYPGTAPLSEPESRWLAEEIERFRPAAIVAVHAPLHVVDYDGPPRPPDRLGSLRLKQLGTYPGSLGRYAGSELGLPVVTIELPNAGTMPAPSEQWRIWLDLVAWLKEHVERQRSTGGSVTTAAPAM